MPNYSSRIAAYAGKPALHLDGQPELPTMYALTDCPGGRYAWEEIPQRQIANFAAAGFRLVQFDIWFSEHLYPNDGPLDLGICLRQIRAITEVCPQAAIMMRLHVNSSMAWNAANPSECVVFADAGYRPAPDQGARRRPLEGDEQNSLRHSLASARWLEQALARTREFMSALAATPEGGSVIGVQIAGGVFGEWHQWGLISHEPDVSPAMLGYFRGWLRRTYGEDAAALAAAWGRPVDFATAGFPSMADRQAVSEGIFRDPRREQATIDYYRALQACVVDAILPLCAAVKESWPRPILAGSFYGYLKFLFGRHATGGHLELERYLASPAIDFLASPQTYPDFCRRLGGTGESRGLLDACRRAGKLCLDEMDQVTHLGSTQIPVLSKNADEDRALIRRNVLQPFTYGMGHWYYDFGPAHQAGAWDRAVFMRDIAELQAFMRGRFARPLDRPADTLVVYDTRSLYHVGNRVETDPVSTLLIDQFYAAMLQSGVIFEDAWLFELPRLDLSRYRTVIFANCFIMDAEMRAVVRNRVCRDGRHVVFNYLTGYGDGRQLDLGFTQALTGLPLRLETWNEPGIHRLGDGPRIGWRQPFVPQAGGFSMDDPLQEPFPAVTRQTWRPIPYPTVVDESHLRVLMRDANTGRPTVFGHQAADHYAWVVSSPLTDPRLVNALLAESGSHLVHDGGDTIYAGHGCLVLHVGAAGRRRLRLPAGPVIDDVLPANHTRVYDLQDGRILLS